MFAFQGWGDEARILETFIPPREILFCFVLFYILKCEDTSLFLCIFKETPKGRGNNGLLFPK